MLHSLFAELNKHIIDLGQVKCKTTEGTDSTRLIGLEEFRSLYPRKECSVQPLTPMGTDIEVKVGSRTSMYCAPRLLTDTLTWEDKRRAQRLPNQFDLKPSNNPQLSIIHSISMQPFDVLQISHRERIQQSHEQLVIQTVIDKDAGDYVCNVERNGEKYQETFKLAVKRPEIKLYSIDVGSHYVALGWNKSLVSIEDVQFSI